MIILRDAACETVRNKGWLSRTPASFQRAVLDRCRLEQFKAGTPIYSIGDKPRGMFGIVAGCLSISVAPAERGPYTAHFTIPGSWFGEVSAFTRQPRSAGLTATRDTVLLHLPHRAFNEIVSNDPSAWRLFGLITIGHLHVAMGGSAISRAGWNTTLRAYRRAFWRASTRSSRSRDSGCQRNFAARSHVPTLWRMS